MAPSPGLTLRPGAGQGAKSLPENLRSIQGDWPRSNRSREQERVFLRTAFDIPTKAPEVAGAAAD